MDVEFVFGPRVVLIAATSPLFVVAGAKDYPFGRWLDDVFSELDGIPFSVEHILEFAGRNCYQSWNRPNPKTARTDDYIRNIISQRHFSVLEHASFTVYIDGISRSCSHQLVRHRHFSFSQLSHRYVRPDKLRVVVPPRYRSDPVALKVLERAAEDSVLAYAALTASSSPGSSKKSINEAARAVLPHMLETSIVVTGNLRAWREFFEKRLSPSADAEIREVAVKCLEVAKKVSPTVFEGFGNLP
jgi:thymidylate synthase (FAD)